MSELVPGVGHGEGFRSFGDAVAGEDLDAFGGGELLGVEAQELGQRDVQLDEARGCYAGWREAGVECCGRRA